MDLHEPHKTLDAMRRLSPKRNSTHAENPVDLAKEQLIHFGIDKETDFGQSLCQFAERLYSCQADIEKLWATSLQDIASLEHPDRIARFNAKKFLSFQLAKILDTLQNPFRRSYQELGYSDETATAKGPYPIFDNVTAIFSATPVIARTATYIYACAEWIEDAFLGKELMHEIYSRLLNPTSVSLANFVVDLEAGPYAQEYFAWNYNSGMAAIDATLAHLLGRDDVLIVNSSVYGGVHQLLHDWYAKPSNLGIKIESFDGYGVEDFAKCLAMVKEKYAERFAEGRKAYVHIESPCNPHGYVLDVPSICKLAHKEGLRVILDATVATSFLCQPLQRKDTEERPDFVIHSYSKDMTGTGSAIAGGVIARNEDMFVPKGQTVDGVAWNETMFWNVYYIKGAFLNADAAFEVIQGMRTLSMRMLTKCINTKILARFLASHPGITVHSHALPDSSNAELAKSLLRYGLPAPLFTTEMKGIPREIFQRFFDSLSPTFGHMISLGQSNTIVSCPALTTHSELNETALKDSGIGPTTIRFAVGDEDPMDLLRHIISSAKLTIDPVVPGFSEQFMPADEIDQFVRETYLSSHAEYLDGKAGFND